MLACEGYRMFFGVCRITPKCDTIAPYDERGTWLYKPEYDTWYANGNSYPAEIVEIKEDCT